jgi:outer membrane immunogenic protein
MKKFLLGVATFFAMGTVAFAADLGRRSIYAPQLLKDWTGCYVGLNAGGVWGHMKEDWTPNNIKPVVVSSFESNGSGSFTASGFTGGGQIGCNWQVAQVLLGAEGDGQYTGLDGSRDALDPAVLAPLGPIRFHEDFRSRWLATARGRFGWLPNPFVLFFATVGAAFAEVDTSDSAINLFNPAEFITVSRSQTRVGWTYGGGVEWKFAPQWSVRAEYLFVDLGNFTATSTDTVAPLATVDHDHHLTEHLARAGVNFHF